MRTSWWLWLLLTLLVIPLVVLHDSNWYALVPANLLSFLYFAHVRFDEDGNRLDEDR